MWNWFNCYLSGRHEFGVWCEPGAIFLRCVHCGRRSTGWTVGTPPPNGDRAGRASPHKRSGHQAPLSRDGVHAQRAAVLTAR